MGDKDSCELRAQLERDYVCAALSAVCARTVLADELLAICPVNMLTEGGEPWAIYRSMSSLVAAGESVTPASVYRELADAAARREVPTVPLDRIGDYTLSIFARRDDAVLRMSAQMAREGRKRKAEYELLALVRECRKYGNETAELATAAREIAAGLENEADSMDESRLDAIMGRVMSRLESGQSAAPLPTPWRNLNAVLKGGAAPGELVVLAARPGMGKTALAGCWAVEVARADIPVLFVSREVKDETVTARILSREARVDSSIFRQGISNAPNILPRLRQAQASLSGLPLHIVERSTAPMTPSEVRRMARSMRGVGLVVVDYLQLMESDKRTNSRELEIAGMSRAFKQLALDCNCPVLLLSQLSRKGEDAGRAPILSDLRESGAIEQDADIVVFLHAQKGALSGTTSPKIQAIVAKGRSSGTGSAWLRFEKQFTNFVESEPENFVPRKREDNGL